MFGSLPRVPPQKCRFERPLAERRKTGTDSVKPLDTFRCRRLRHIYQGVSNTVCLRARMESPRRALSAIPTAMEATKSSRLRSSESLLECIVTLDQCRPGRSTGGCAVFETCGIHLGAIRRPQARRQV